VSQFLSHGFPVQIDTISIDSALFTPVGIVDELMVLGHWQISETKTKINNYMYIHIITIIYLYTANKLTHFSKLLMHNLNLPVIDT